MGLDKRWSELSGLLTSYPVEMVQRIWEFWKDRELRFYRPSVQLSFSDQIKADQFGSRPTEMSRDLRHHKMHRAWAGVSIVWLV